MENINILNKLGSGMLGDVYLCTVKNNNYALKIEKISPKNLNYDLSIQEWREIDFSQSFANYYPEQFITLCAHDIKKDNKNRKYNYSNKRFSNKVIQRLKEKTVSKYAIRKLYTLVDDTLKSVIDTLTLKQLFSTIVQISYICYLMQTKGYSHNDLHIKNIGIINVNPGRQIDILNKKVTSHGIHIKALDFGISLHEKYGLNKEEMFVHKYGLINDINRFIIRLIKFDFISDDDPNFDAQDEQIKKIYNWNDEPKIFDEFINSKDYECVEEFGVNKYDRFYLYQILFPEKFQRMILGKKFKKVSLPIPRIDMIDILFIFKNKLNLKTIMKYFIKKANS